MKIKTLDINALEWFDKINGNSYFSCTIVINYSLKDEKVLEMPFSYGYGDYYMQAAKELLIKEKLIKDVRGGFWSYCKDNNIILRNYKEKNCKKRDLKK